MSQKHLYAPVCNVSLQKILTNVVFLIFRSPKEAPVTEETDVEKSPSDTSLGGHPDDIYQPGWGVVNGSRLDNAVACQDMVDHIVPPACFAELRRMPSGEFLEEYNKNLATTVALGSQLRLRYEQEVHLRRKVAAKVVRRDARIEGLDGKLKALSDEVKVLGAQAEAEAVLKKAAEARATELEKELLELRAQHAKTKIDNQLMVQEIATLQAQVLGEEKIKAAFEDFKKAENERVERRCAEMDARLDALSVDFDEELYPHMLTAIAGRRWVIGHGLRLAAMKCAESQEIREAFANVVSARMTKGYNQGLEEGAKAASEGKDIATLDGYDPESEEKLIEALQALKSLKYPLIDELEELKDAPISLLMASLHLESAMEDDAPEEVRALTPNTSQLMVPVYPKVRDPNNPWVIEREMLLEDALAANVSRAEMKKKNRVRCRTHGVGSAHHARSDGVPVSVPLVPQGLQIVLSGEATQTKESGSEPNVTE